jgi:hypothetical protein
MHCPPAFMRAVASSPRGRLSRRPLSLIPLQLAMTPMRLFALGLNSGAWCQFKARMTPMRANMVAPPPSATDSNPNREFARTDQTAIWSFVFLPIFVLLYAIVEKMHVDSCTCRTAKGSSGRRAILSLLLVPVENSAAVERSFCKLLPFGGARRRTGSQTASTSQQRHSAECLPREPAL